MGGDADGCTRIYNYVGMDYRSERQRGVSIDEIKILCSRVEITPSSKLLAKVGRYDIDIALMISLGS
jgi:hypothetical protein